MFRYDPDLARFEDIPTSDKPRDQRHLSVCLTVLSDLGQTWSSQEGNFIVFILLYLHSTYSLHINCVESYCSHNTVTRRGYWKVKWWGFLWCHERWRLLKCNVTYENQSSGLWLHELLFHQLELTLKVIR